MKLFAHANLMALALASVSTVSLLGPCLARAACGVIEATKGDVKIQSATTKTETPAVLGGKVCSGDTVTSGPGARAKLKMEDGNELNVSPDSKISLENYQYEPAQNKKSVLLNVLRGKVRAATKQENMYNDKSQDGADNSFQVKTKTAVAGVRGTDFMTGYDPKTGQSQVVTFRGVVSFGSPGPGGQILNPVSVKAGQSTNVAPGQPPAPPHIVPPAQLQQINSDTKAEPPANSANGAAANGSAKSSGGSANGGSAANNANSGGSTSQQGSNSSGGTGTSGAGAGASGSGPSAGSDSNSGNSSAGPSSGGGANGGPAPASVQPSSSMGGGISGGGLGGGSMLNSADLGGAAGTTGPNQVGINTGGSIQLPPPVTYVAPAPVVVPVCTQCVTAIQNSNATAKGNVVITITLPH